MSKRVIANTTDGVEGIVVDGNKVIRYRTQNTDSYYKENKFRRDNIDKSAVNRHWALPVANIPFADYQNLVKADPELKHTDAKIRTAAWLKLLKTSACEQLRTVRRNLVPDNAEPDSTSILMPYKEKEDAVQ